MTWWQAIILGIVQGLGEFLPISSSGHLVLFQNIFNIRGEELLFDSLLHLGTLIAVFIVLWKDIWEILKKPIRKVTLNLIIATIPAVLAALLLGDFIDKAFGGAYLGWGFLLTAIILFLTTKIKQSSEDTDLDKINTKQTLVMGTMQALAILPGVSRAGATICGGLFTKANRDAVTRFSFLMSIPAILGSLVYNVKDLLKIGTSENIIISNVILGTAAAAIAGVLSLKLMIRLVKKGKLWIFGVYVLILAIAVLADKYFMHIIF